MYYEVIDEHGNIRIMDREELQYLHFVRTGRDWDSEMQVIHRLWQQGIAVRGAYE